MTDLAITAYEGGHGLDITLRSLQDGRPVPDTTVQLVAQNNDILAESRTDEQGRVTFEDVECLQLQLKQGKTVKDMFVEEKTGRLVGVKAVMPTPMGELPTTSVIEKWITIGPRKVPSRTVIKMMGMEQVMQIDKVVTDSFDPDVFDLPPAIKALADAKKAAKKASDGDASSSGSKDSSSSSGGGR